MTTKTQIADYQKEQIEYATKQLLYWMGNTAKELKEGNGVMAHHDLTNALRFAFDLALAQQTAKAVNGFGELDLDYNKIYADSVIYAQKEIESENK